MDEMLKQQLKEEVAQFRQKAEQFMRGEINIKEFKGFSGGFGSYAQRGIPCSSRCAISVSRSMNA